LDRCSETGSETSQIQIAFLSLSPSFFWGVELKIKESLGSLLLCVVLVAIWVVYYYFVIQPVMDVPLWTVGGILILLGAIALAVVLAIISIILVIAIFD